MTITTTYTKNLTDPGEPWMKINALNNDGEFVEIQQHPAHFFEDTGTGFGPHYKGPDGFHYLWDGPK